MLPIPSTVVTAIPSTAHNGSKQPFAEKCIKNVKDNGKKMTLTRTFSYIKNNGLFQKKIIFKFSNDTSLGDLSHRTIYSFEEER